MMPWVYALHFQTVPWVHVILSRLQGRSTALSLWFKIAVNLTKWQFISPAKLRKLGFQPEETLFLRIQFHYSEGKIICTPPPRLCRFSLLATKYIFSSWLFFSFPNIAWKWMQMSRMQSSPFQELVLLNILIHRMIITLKHRVLYQLLKKNRSSDCAVHHVDNQQKSRNSGNDSTQSQARFIKTIGKVSNTTTKSTQSGLVETIAVDPNREHDIKSIDTSCDLVITILLSHIDDIRFWSVLSFSVDFAEETCLTANVKACMAGVTSKRGRVRRIRARGEGRGNACKNPIIFFFQPSPNWYAKIR